MRLSTVLAFSTQLLLATSLPISSTPTSDVVARGDGFAVEAESHEVTKRIPATEKKPAQNGTAAGGAAGGAAEGGKEGAKEGSKEGAKEGAAEGGEEGKENEKEVEGQFNVPVRLTGANLKQDVLFPPAKNGRLEVEFQNAVGRTLTVTENRSPAAPPAGFTAVEAVSYKINLAEGAQGMALSKVDYILNAGNTLDISKGQIGRLFPEANAFIIDPALGELEFEAEENELTLKVANINGEFAIFLPQAAGAGNAGAAGRQ